MRILHLASYSLFSGPVPSTMGLALAQRQLGHTVWLGHDTKRGAINDFEEAADPWIAETNLAMPTPLTLSAKSSPAELTRDIFRLRRFVQERQIDLVHCHLSHDHLLTALAGLKKQCAVIRTIHSQRPLANKWGRRMLNKAANGWVVRCEEHAQALKKQLFGNHRTSHPHQKRVVTIAGGIDSERFQPAPSEASHSARSKFGIPLNAQVLGHVALIADRGQTELVDALTIVHESQGAQTPHILFVGRGEHENILREHVKQSPVAKYVHFAGYLQGEELNHGYAAMNAAFCAQAGNDASARAALEAMGCGLPVLAIEVGALAETVTTQTGYTIASRTPSAIAAQINAWSANQALAINKGRTGRAFVKTQRSFSTEARKTVELYESCL